MPRVRRSLVVVGGGVAGLTCAWSLQRAGHEVEVLERESVPGGRMRSERHGDFVVERGASFVTSGYRNLHDVVRALGLEAELRVTPPVRNVVLRGGKLLPADVTSPWRLLTSPLLSPLAKLRLARLPLEVVRHRRLLDPRHPERAAALDGENLDKQGVVDGAENNAPSFYLSHHYEVCKYYSLDEHTAVPDVLVISTRIWNSLTPEFQRLLQEAANESAQHQRKLWTAATRQALAAVEAAGVQVIYPDKILFAEQVEPLYETYRTDAVIYHLIQEIKRSR